MKKNSDLSAEQLANAIAQARGGQTGAGALWSALKSALGVEDSVLSSALHERYGIVVLDDEQWLRTSIHSAVNATQAGLHFIKLDGRLLLASDDPWSEASMLALARQGDASTYLLLTRPGQSAGSSGSPKEAKLRTGRAEEGSTGPVTAVGYVDRAVVDAYRLGASDIHFETDRQGVGVKFRIDGVMTASARLDSPSRAEEVISRIKVMAQLDITERRRPQDGRIHWERPGAESIDLRVSIMPSIFGEDAVLRLLDKAQLRDRDQAISLDTLGFPGVLAASIRRLAAKPHGMLLITGPTGSGKTTTVYAALSEVHTGLEKIVTIEDPVEYELPGILQIPVNEQKGLTFATGLRSILRHDPDKILVGEIRDAETAEIAIQSSLTGHLVLTTVHANSLFDVLGRFRHFGIEPFAMASALNGVVVQRLLRRLCPHCSGRRPIEEAEHRHWPDFGLPVPVQVPQAMGCQQCRGTGYRGRLVVAEVHVLDDDFRDLVTGGATTGQLRGVIRDKQMEMLGSQALRAVLRHETTLEEVHRVVGLD